MRLQLVIAGLGGQGVLFITRLVCQIAYQKGFAVFASETHGMSQRGGSVVSYVKIGEFHSPVIKKGMADVVIGLQKEEGLRNLPMMKRDGTLVLNASSVPAVAHGRALYMDADGMAFELGNPWVSNVILIGYACSQEVLPFSLGDLEQALVSLSPPHMVDINLQAVRKGFQIKEVWSAGRG